MKLIIPDWLVIVGGIGQLFTALIYPYIRHVVFDWYNDIKKLNKPVIACCASGMRSSQATSILKKNGIEVINGGGWKSLQSKL